jgi:hypothetical protein
VDCDSLSAACGGCGIADAIANSGKGNAKNGAEFRQLCAK